ncbi:Na+/H+ antiporter subunit A [Aquipuribacter sp. MA13-6]|uniref:Na+/H+ antiporter subunit A n=1 Tax=unclassified Aquipuribacter TaxID=2635084 RepID=UPI003EEE3DD5
MIVLVGAHLLAACLAPWLVRRLGRDALALLALVPAAALVWLVAHGPSQQVERATWMPEIHLDLVLRLDALSWLMAVVVCAVGTLVLVYSSRYLDRDHRGLPSLTANLMAFTGVMLGLVLADNTLLLFVFWELTTVFSYLLIGEDSRRKASRRAAMQALVVTTAGGLTMLVGLIVLGETGSYELSALVADPPSGPVVDVAVLLVVIGALSKSALFPLHFWLPAAMAAPTPISAFLHAAAMVKAGVYLVARLAPGFADVGLWRPVVISLGLTTLVLGAWRALRQTDLKLLLAFGTVSQLGLMVVLVGLGTREAMLAGLAMLLAHATFKAALFLVVGAVDHTTGTRDIRELAGLGRRQPLLLAVGATAAAGMAGLPPFAAFVGKEAAYEALLHPGVLSPPVAGAALAVMALGSGLTVAYSARFVWGAFGGRTADDAPADHPLSPVLLVPAALLAAATLAIGVLVPWLDGPVVAHADLLPAGYEGTYELALWHGLSPALWLSLTVIALGLLAFVRRDAVGAFQQRVGGHGDADLAYRRTMRGLDRLAGTVTAATQTGSLPRYLTVILLVLLVLPGAALAGAFRTWDLRAWDTPLQAVVAGGIIACAVAAVRIRQRLAAVVLVGVSGYGIGILFALHGAPDLALTQFLAESVTLVVFVLVLRRLPKTISQRHGMRLRLARLAVAVPVGLLMAGLAATAIGAGTNDSVSEEFPAGAYDFGGGANVVNVTLVDIRAWDTMLEVAVLVVAATGVASLVFIDRRTGTPQHTGHASAADAERGRRVRADRSESGSWLRGSEMLPRAERSVVLEVVTRLLFHPIVLVSLYLLFAGHNAPGGGFAGGLVAGLALVLRYLAGGRYELGEAAPLDAGLLLGGGLVLAGGTGVLGLLGGADVLQTAIIEFTMPVYGDVKLVTSLFFDMGVYLIVVGLVLDVLRSLGAELDRQEAELQDDAADAPAPRPQGVTP